MSLQVRLSALLSLVFSALLFGAFAISYPAEQRRIEDERLQRIFRALSVISAGCGAAPSCLEEVRFISASVYPKAFRHAVLAGPDLRVLSHSDFLSGDRSLKGTVVSDPHVLAAMAQPKPLIQAGPSGLSYFSTRAAYPSEAPGTWVLVYSKDGLEEAVAPLRRDSRRRLVQSLLVGTGAGLLFSIVLSFYLLAPLRSLAGACGRIASGDFEVRLPADRTDELGSLMASFNSMAGRLAELDRLKRDFLNRVTHDQKNPLNAILFKVELLLDGFKGALAPGQAEALKAVHENALALSDMVSNALDLTRLDAGSLKLEPVQVNLAAEVDYAVESARVKAKPLGVSLERRVDDESLTLQVDRESLQRVLRNLLSNAVAFTPSGGRVGVTGRKERDWVVVTVADTGVGIPKERVPGLFQPFSRIPETRNAVRPTPGAGLGLAVCRRLIEAQKGSIWLESSGSDGSRFSFKLPAAQA